MKILIIEDEALAFEKLEMHLLEVAPNVTITWKRDLDSLKSYLENHQPDLIFSDIQLTEGTVFNVLDTIDISCPIIFCTAYNTYYQNAFKFNGIAYLLKPFTKSEFLSIWEKYTTLFKSNTHHLEQLKHQLKEVFETKNYSTTLTVKKKDSFHVVAVKTIIYIQSKGDFAVAYDQNKKMHILAMTLSKLESILDPSRFLRINRSEIVQKDFILRYKPHIKSRLAVVLRTEPETTLYTSNSKASSFKKWISL